MSKKNSKISPELKSKIMSQCRTGMTVSRLAKLYNISKTVIYDWNRAAKNAGNASIEKINSNFVELSVEDTCSDQDRTDKITYAIEDAPGNALEKASLIFNNLSFVIEGRITSVNLIAIIKILGV